MDSSFSCLSFESVKRENRERDSSVFLTLEEENDIL